VPNRPASMLSSCLITLGGRRRCHRWLPSRKLRRRSEVVGIVTELARQIRGLLSDPGYVPLPVQSPPPILIAGVGDRMLTAAARHADIVAITTMGNRDHLADRLVFLRARAGDRWSGLELSFGFFQTTIDDPNDLAVLRMLVPGTSDDELRKLVAHLGGPVESAADQIRSQRRVRHHLLHLQPHLRHQLEHFREAPRGRQVTFPPQRRPSLVRVRAPQRVGSGLRANQGLIFRTGRTTAGVVGRPSSGGRHLGGPSPTL
jgi:alkanesulfonate monooxygenase SsuD/methylene tetrahydromethanopterin reductase-like flavin-dependent oxidoreductase (luciferase family)